MLSRTLGRGLIGIVFTVLAIAPAGLAISPVTAQAQTATAAGEDDGGGTTTPPVTDTQPTQPVPVLPAPPATPAPAPPAPVPQTHKRKQSKRTTPAKTQPVVQQTAAVSAVTTSDTQTFPQGGVQAGEGGTSQHGSSSALLGLGSGLLAFGLAAGVQARRRQPTTR